ncbi:MAG TPA: NAD(P)H-hydrate dehydratase [Candidatus Nanoarchaeia archaeon]|nr:NAD(P)H-hydrate dehydratase [Candidatus Nanoarchaeia archaeon]
MKFLSKKDLKIPKRSPSSHKGDNGVVLAVGGSREYPGAITLSSLAALRSGCDIVRVAAPEKVAWAVNAYSPDVITIKLKGEYITERHYPILQPYLEKSDVLLLGNGMTISREGKALCRKIVKNNKLKVIDADALKMLSLQDLRNSIVTPHLRELEALLRNSKISITPIKTIINEKDTKKRASLIQNAAKQWLEKNNIILLKGKIDTIISKDGIFYNRTGNAGMTRGGTGDVLAGLCAGYLAQSKDLLQSAKNAIYINGMIGDILLRKKKGFTYLASDMVEEIRRISRR